MQKRNIFSCIHYVYKKLISIHIKLQILSATVNDLDPSGIFLDHSFAPSIDLSSSNIEFAHFSLERREVSNFVERLRRCFCDIGSLGVRISSPGAKCEVQ